MVEFSEFRILFQRACSKRYRLLALLYDVIGYFQKPSANVSISSSEAFAWIGG